MVAQALFAFYQVWHGTLHFPGAGGTQGKLVPVHVSRGDSLIEEFPTLTSPALIKIDVDLRAAHRKAGSFTSANPATGKEILFRTRRSRRLANAILPAYLRSSDAKLRYPDVSP